MSKTMKKVLKMEPKNLTLKSVNKEKLKNNSDVKIDINQQSMSKQSKRLNEEFIKILGEFGDLMMKKGEPFRARAYLQAESALIKYPDDITSVAELKKINGVGSTIIKKFEEYLQSGKIESLEKERNDPVNILGGIYGIGPVKAKDLVKNGITTVEQLRDPDNMEKLLNDKQKIGVKYYEDILKRIPRAEIVEFSKLFGEIFNKVVPEHSEFKIVGSFRRGAETSGDIDIIITNKNNNRNAFDKVLDVLTKNNIITEVLSRGKIKSLTLVKIKDDAPTRRVDFLYTPPNEYAFALLYFTGSKLFNTIVRQRALDLGYTLNEHGLSYINKGVKGPLVDEYFPTEESILNFLGIEYVNPENRVNVKSVKIIKKIENDVSTSKDEEDISEEALMAALDAISVDKEPVLWGDQSKECMIPKEEDISEKDLLAALEIEAKPKITLKPKNKTLKKHSDTKDITKYINSFKQDGIQVLKMSTEKELSELLEYTNKKYYCDDYPVLSDNEYDIVREYVLEKYPDNIIAKTGHATCNMEVAKNKLKLPYELWSMDKIKPTTDELDKWTKKYKGPYVISAKLDGISALYVNDKNGKKMYTRGNGKYGQDISHLIPYLVKDSDMEIAIRGEIIISKDNFDKYCKKDFANPRNFLGGIVNRKTVDPEIVKYVDFVVYEMIHPQMKPFAQLLELGAKEIKHVKFDMKEEISNDMLSEILLEWRDNYEYQIDGIIVVNDEIYPRPKKNPEYAFAFKMVLSDQVAEAKVVDVLWTPSKDGYLKPRVQIEPLTLGGVCIEYATGFNAKYVNDNKIGVGAVITIIRSGDVIPHIVNVVSPADIIKFPNDPYKWNDTKVDIVLADKDSHNTVREKNIVLFFKNLEVEGIGPGNVKKIMTAGFDSVAKILSMKESDYLTVDGFKNKTANKLYNGIKDKVSTASLVKIMTASNVFGRGFGEINLTKILEKYPGILISDESDNVKKDKLLKVEGIATKTAGKFVEHITEFIDFVKKAKLEYKLEITETVNSIVDSNSPLYGKKIVMTSFRDKELMDKIKSFGGEISNSVSKNTFVLLVKEDKNETTSKAEMARSLEIPIMTKHEFEKKYIFNV